MSVGQIQVFILFHDLGLGGIQKKIVTIANYFSNQQRYTNIFSHVVLTEDIQPNYSQEITSRVNKIHYIPRMKFLRRYQKYYSQIYYLYLLCKIQPKSCLIFSLEILETMLKVKKYCIFCNIKIIFSLDTIMSHYNSPVHTKPVFTKSKINYLLSQVDQIITQTKYSKTDLITNYEIKNEKITVIPNWFASDVLRSKQKKSIDIIYHGRFSKQKQLHLALQLFESISHKRPQTNLYLIGEGEDKVQLKKYAERKLFNSVVIKPTSENVLDEVCKSKIFILTSAFEGHPIALLEAMALGAVPVVLNYPGCNEYLTNGHDGFVEKTPNKMAKRILYLLENPSVRLKISNNAKNTVKLRYGKNQLRKTIKLMLAS